MTTIKQIITDVAKHNQEIFDATPRNEKIDFSKCKKNWGTNVVPEEFWIDIDKKYVTVDGRVVTLHNCVMKNSSGNEVTYPIKGSVITPRDGKKDLKENMIWSLDGRADVNSFSNNDLVVLTAA